MLKRITKILKGKTGNRRQAKPKDTAQEPGQQPAGNDEVLQCILESIGEPVMIIRPDHTFAWLNRAAQEFLIGSSPERKYIFCYECHGKNGPCGENENCPIQEARKTNDIVRGIHEHSDPDGKKHILEFIAAPITRDGQFHGIVQTARDITATPTTKADSTQQPLPICTWCKAIRDKNGDWHHPKKLPPPNTQIIHSICNDCLKKVKESQ